MGEDTNMNFGEDDHRSPSSFRVPSVASEVLGSTQHIMNGPGDGDLPCPFGGAHWNE